MTDTTFDDTPELSYSLDGVRFYYPPDVVRDWGNRENVGWDAVPSRKQGYPSVTSVLNVIDKPGLGRAALNLTVDHMLDNAEFTARRLGEDNEEGSVRASAVKYFRGYHRDVWDRKANKGTAHHMWLFRVKSEGECPVAVDREMGGVIDGGVARPLLRWWDDNVRGFVASEGRVYNTRLCYAGSFDGVVELMDGRRACYDLKTGRRPYGVTALQLMAYEMCDKLAVPLVFNDRGFPTRFDIVDAPSSDVGLVLHFPGGDVGHVYEVEYSNSLRQAVAAARVLFEWNRVAGLKHPGMPKGFWLDDVVRERWVSDHRRVDCRDHPVGDETYDATVVAEGALV